MDPRRLPRSTWWAVPAAATALDPSPSADHAVRTASGSGVDRGCDPGIMRPERMSILYRNYGAAIYARCRSLLTDEGAAEDATQETFLRVWRRLDRVPDAQEALRWIYRVATNYCLNEIRDRRKRDIPTAELPERSERPEVPEARMADRDLARRLVEHAGAKVRLVAWLYHVDGFEQEEIAAVVGISRRTVVNRLSDFRDGAQRFLKRSAG